MVRIHRLSTTKPTTTISTTQKEEEQQIKPPNSRSSISTISSSSSSSSISKSLNFKNFSSENLHNQSLPASDPQPSTSSTKSNSSVPIYSQSSIAAKRDSDYISDKNLNYSQPFLEPPTDSSDPRHHSSEIPMASANIAQVNFTSARDLRPHDNDKVTERITNKLSNVK